MHLERIQITFAMQDLKICIIDSCLSVRDLYVVLESKLSAQQWTQMPLSVI